MERRGPVPVAAEQVELRARQAPKQRFHEAGEDGAPLRRQGLASAEAEDRGAKTGRQRSAERIRRVYVAKPLPDASEEKPSRSSPAKPAVQPPHHQRRCVASRSLDRVREQEAPERRVDVEAKPQARNCFVEKPQVRITRARSPSEESVVGARPQAHTRLSGEKPKVKIKRAKGRSSSLDADIGVKPKAKCRPAGEKPEAKRRRARSPSSCEELRARSPPKKNDVVTKPQAKSHLSSEKLKAERQRGRSPSSCEELWARSPPKKNDVVTKPQAKSPLSGGKPKVKRKRAKSLSSSAMPRVRSSSSSEKPRARKRPKPKARKKAEAASPPARSRSRQKRKVSRSRSKRHGRIDADRGGGHRGTRAASKARSRSRAKRRAASRGRKGRSPASHDISAVRRDRSDDRRRRPSLARRPPGLAPRVLGIFGRNRSVGRRDRPGFGGATAAARRLGLGTYRAKPLEQGGHGVLAPGLQPGADGSMPSTKGTLERMNRGGRGMAAKGPFPGVSGACPDRFSEELWEMPRQQLNLRLVGELAPANADWQYVLKDESRRSFAGYHPSPFSSEQCKSFFENARDGTDWKQPQGRAGPIPRKTAWMVREGCSCAYGYGGIQVPPQIFPPWMIELMKLAMPYCGLTEGEWPNSCNLNLYEDGAMSVGWHSDDEALFQGKFQDIRILSLSLGARRKFELRANWPQPGENALRPLMLGDGDLCTMEGMTQKHFQHRVPKESYVQGQRINLTWRWTVKHNPRCSAGRMRGPPAIMHGLQS